MIKEDKKAHEQETIRTKVHVTKTGLHVNQVHGSSRVRRRSERARKPRIQRMAEFNEQEQKHGCRSRCASQPGRSPWQASSPPQRPPHPVLHRQKDQWFAPGIALFSPVLPRTSGSGLTVILAIALRVSLTSTCTYMYRIALPLSSARAHARRHRDRRTNGQRDRKTDRKTHTRACTRTHARVSAHTHTRAPARARALGCTGAFTKQWRARGSGLPTPP